MVHRYLPLLLTLHLLTTSGIALDSPDEVGVLSFTAKVGTFSTTLFGGTQPGAVMEIRHFADPERRFWNLRYAGNQWILRTGDGYVIHTGQDFESWTHLQIPQAGFFSNLLYSNGVYLCTGNFQEALASEDRRSYAVSTDLQHWKVPQDPARAFGNFFVWNDAFYHNQAGKLSRSTDGIHWEVVLPKPVLLAWSGRMANNLRFTPHREFLFAHSSEAIWVSSDGHAWDEIFRDSERRGDGDPLHVALWRDHAIIQRGLTHDPRSNIRRIALRSNQEGSLERTGDSFFIDRRFAVWEPGGLIVGRLPDGGQTAPGLYLTSDFVEWETLFFAQEVDHWDFQSIAVSNDIVAGMLEQYLIIRRMDESLASDRPAPASPPFPFEPQALPPVIPASSDPRIRNTVASYQRVADQGDHEIMASFAAMLMEADQWTEINLPRARHYFSRLEKEKPDLLNPLLYARCLLEFEPLEGDRIIRLLEAAIQKKQRGAWYLLGRQLLFGTLGPADPSRALAVLEDGVANRDPEAIRFLGQTFTLGYGGVPLDFERADALASELTLLGQNIWARDLQNTIVRERTKLEESQAE